MSLSITEKKDIFHKRAVESASAMRCAFYELVQQELVLQQFADVANSYSDRMEGAIASANKEIAQMRLNYVNNENRIKTCRLAIWEMDRPDLMPNDEAVTSIFRRSTQELLLDEYSVNSSRNFKILADLYEMELFLVGVDKFPPTNPVPQVRVLPKTDATKQRTIERLR